MCVCSWSAAAKKDLMHVFKLFYSSNKNIVIVLYFEHKPLPFPIIYATNFLIENDLLLVS